MDCKLNICCVYINYEMKEKEGMYKVRRMIVVSGKQRGKVNLSLHNINEF